MALLMLCRHDLRDRRLPNEWVLSFIVLYFLEAIVLREVWSSTWPHLVSAGLAFCVALALFRAGWMGGGDVKLAGAVFLWAGPAECWAVFCLISSAGGVLALLMLAFARVAGRMPRLRGCVGHSLDLARGVPYGVALACGGAWAVCQPAINLFNF